MSITSKIESAVDSSAGRLTARLTTLTDRRPDEPRNFVGSFPGYLSWTPPQINDNFTHYRLRIGHDDGEPDYEFTSGQLGIQLFIGSVFFLSTYNDTNGLESGPVVLEYDTQSDLLTLVSGGGSGGETEVTAYYEMTSGPFPIPCTPSPQSGVELIVILKQDATGGRTPSWASCFKNAPTSQIDGTASTLSMVGFSYYGGYWWRKSLETGLPDVP